MKVDRMRTSPRMSEAVAAGGMVWLACTQSSLARPNCRIEVMVTAVSADREVS